jgi:hypothetical protein
VKTTRDILPTLAALPPGQFFYCTRKGRHERAPSTLSYNIHRKRIPPMPLTPDARTITQNGLLYISPSNQGDYTPMKHFLDYKEKLFMTSVLPVFHNWYLSKSFIKWRYRLKWLRFKRSEGLILDGCPYGHTEFLEWIGETRDFVFDVFSRCYYVDSKQPSTTFDELTENARGSLVDLKQKLLQMKEEFSERLAHFCSQVRDIALLLRTDYQVLRTMGAIPKAVVPYVIEHEVNAPSLTVCRVRNELLFKERRRAYDRKMYLPRFFIFVKLTMRELLMNQLHATLGRFYFRFTEDPSTTTHQIQLLLDPELGLRMYPSLDQFLAWFAHMEAEMSTILLAEHTEMPEDAFDLLYPDRDCPVIDFLDSVRENHALDVIRDGAIQLIREAYAYFTQRSAATAAFMRELQSRALELVECEDYEDASAFVMVADEISDLLAELDSLQRMVVFRSLHTDLKPAKTSALELMRKLSDKARGIGIARTKAIYEQIEQVKNMYAKSVTMNKMMNVVTETPDLVECKQQIATLCASYLPIAESVLTHWADAAIEIEEQYGIAQDTLALITAAQRPKRRGRVRRRAGRNRSAT